MEKTIQLSNEDERKKLINKYLEKLPKTNLETLYKIGYYCEDKTKVDININNIINKLIDKT